MDKIQKSGNSECYTPSSEAYGIYLQSDVHYVGFEVMKNSISVGYFFNPEDGSDIPLKHWLTFSGLHCVISQKIELYSLLNISCIQQLFSENKMGHNFLKDPFT